MAVIDRMQSLDVVIVSITRKELRELEWSGCGCGMGMDYPVCPVCREGQESGKHEPYCWIGKALENL